MTITQKINMDLARRGVTPRVPAVQGDSYTRVVEISLYENGVAWTVPENASVLLRFRKPDGTGGLYDTLPDGAPAWSAADHVVQVTLAPQVLAVPGVVQAQLEIVLDAQSIASFTFHIYVEGDPSNGAAASEEYFNWNDWANKALNEAVKDIPSDYVRTVNGVEPDADGNVEIAIPDYSEKVDAAYVTSAIAEAIDATWSSGY